MSVKKPSHEEDEFFAKEDAVARHALAVERQRQLESAERERIKQLHFMKCPKCGYALEPIRFRTLTVDKCFHCNGTWLDAGELETLAGHESDLLKRIVAVFKP